MVDMLEPTGRMRMTSGTARHVPILDAKFRLGGEGSCQLSCGIIFKRDGPGAGRRGVSAEPAFGFPPLRAGVMACDMDMLGSLFDPKASRLFKVHPGASARPGQIPACVTTLPGLRYLICAFEKQCEHHSVPQQLSTAAGCA